MAETLLRDPPGRLGPAELAPIRELLHRVPVVLGAHDVPAGAWAAGGIPHEASTRGDPYDVRRVPRYGGDLDVVAVRDHRHVRPRLHAGPQRTFDLVDLAHAVQLVAGEVEQDEHVRVQLLRDIRDVELVDLERDHVLVPSCEQCGDDAGVHVVAALVGGDAVARLKRVREHPGGGGLAVRAGDQHCRAALAELREEVRVDGVGDEPADHSARTAAGLLGRPRREVCGLAGDAAAQAHAAGAAVAIRILSFHVCLR